MNHRMNLARRSRFLRRLSVITGLSAGVNSVAWAQYTTTGHNIPIPDNSFIGATLDLVVNDSGFVSDLDVGVIITHSWQGDVIASLEHVGFGTSVMLINRPAADTNIAAGYSADNFGNLTTGAYFILDDEAIGVYDPP